MNRPKYIAQLQHVREVSLLGTADLEFWTEKLQAEQLLPTVVDGQAQIMISGIESRYMGLKFRELVIAVFTANAAGGGARDGAFLIQAFNSSRLLAWCERTFFATPYVHARIDIAIDSPTLGVEQAGEPVLRAMMAPHDSDCPRQPLWSSDEVWEGPNQIPTKTTRAPNCPQQFFARLSGVTTAYTFDSVRDEWTIKSESSVAAIRWFRDSGFAPRQWSIRHDAHHARSKTVRR